MKSTKQKTTVAELTKNELDAFEWKYEDYKKYAGHNFHIFLGVSILVGISMLVFVVLALVGYLNGSEFDGGLSGNPTAFIMAAFFVLCGIGGVVFSALMLKKRKKFLYEFYSEYSNALIQDYHWNFEMNASQRASAARIASGSWGGGSTQQSKTSASPSYQSTRVSLKDGTELHTEQRFGDYKEYLYDQDGHSTGLHISGDKVYDDSWNEQGHFDSNGTFIPKG